MERHAFMEQIAHRVDEDHSRSAPGQRLPHLLRHESKVESLLVGMARHAAKAFGEGFGVTVLAAWTDRRAAANRVPGGVCPFDIRFFAHEFSPFSRASA